MKIETAQFIRSAFSRQDFIRDDRPEVAFVGRSNVGKSSLLNRLLGRKSLARTSSTPGRTRSVNYFLVNDRFYFVDLPGYGYAKAGKAERRQWARLVGDYFSQPRALGVAVVQIVDAEVGATALDVEAFHYLRSLGADPLVTATKVDRLSRGRWPRAAEAIREALQMPAGGEAIVVSARTGEGMNKIWRQLASHLRSSARDEGNNEARNG